jgi:hypothetical protein
MGMGIRDQNRMLMPNWKELERITPGWKEE